MKKRITLLLLSALLLINLTACNTAPTNTDESTFDAQTADSNTTDTVTSCTHIFGEWSISKEATEREDGEEIRNCSRCEYFETKILHAKGTKGLLFTLSEDGTSYFVNAGSATEGDVVIPAYHNGLPVTSIGYIGFGNSDFEPEEVEIGSYAFFDCADLKTAVIPSTVTVIGDMAFARCESLESIVLPPAVTVIGDGAFMLCENLESIVIPQSVKEIGEYAFALTAEDVSDKYFDDIKVSVPNSQVILILREWQVLTASGVEIYYLDENGNEVLIADTYFDNDGYCPFDNGDFEIINNNDTTFSVRAGSSSNKEEWTEKTFDIPQCVSVFVPKAEDTVTVFYGGNNSEAWDAINITATGNKRLTNPVIYYYSETEPTETNKFWHYVDGIPTLW